MRIAISGSHRSGKSTLVEELSRFLPEYKTVEEPYHLMVEDGFELNHPPSLDDFEAQLERSLEELSAGGNDVLFDRCPVDFVGYISAHEDADSFALGEWLSRIRAAVRTLDLVVFVPIEEPDRITLASSEDDDESRALVDEKLRDLLLEDSLNLGLEVLEVAGEPAQRARTVLRRIRRGR